jgi:hypothetical protein
MPKLKLIGTLVIAGLLLFSYMFFDYSMLQKATVDSSDSSTAMSAFAQSSAWLYKMLKPGEKAIVPTSFVFEALNPELKNSLIDCQTIWDSAGVKFHERASQDRLNVLHNFFNQFLKDNPEIKYVIKDWVDPYDKYLFEGNLELASILKEAEVIPFTLSTGWSNKIVIFEQVTYALSINENFSFTPAHYHLYPSNVSVTFGSGGAEINKNMEQVGLYLDLQKGLNCSKNNYVLLNVTSYLQNCSLTLVFYYDNNKDGVFSGYDSTDYTKSGLFQLEQDLTQTRTYLLYQSIPEGPDPAVQIGIIINGYQNGSIILHNLRVFTDLR